MSDQPQRLVLASSSPRRLSLLRQVGLEPDQIVSPDIDETLQSRELPRDYAERMAISKLQSVIDRHLSSFVIAADTVVACGRRVLPKTENADEARSCLALLSGRRHRVIGGVAVQGPSGKRSIKLALTMVEFKRLSDVEIERYLKSDEWHGKAGGYAIQGFAEVFVERLNGSYSNVVGLPLSTVARMLTGLGWRFS